MPDREEILRRFTLWLDEALAEEPPRGIPAVLLDAAEEPAGGDLYAMQAAVTALTQEMKLQGRAFKQLGETLGPVAGMAPGLETVRADARAEARREVLDALLDLRDRLVRGAETAESSARALEMRPPWWRPAGRELGRAKEIADSLREGYELTSARLEEILQSYGVSEIECRKQPFDPRSMQAIGAEERADTPEGTVLEVYRRGYEWNGEIYRTAQVRVSRRPGGGNAKQGAA